MRASGWVTCGVIAIAFSAGSCARIRVWQSESRRATVDMVRAEIDARRPPQYVTPDRDGTRLWRITREFYRKRAFTPAWLDDGRPESQMDQLVAAIRAANDDGLDPALYGATHLEGRLKEATKGLLRRKRVEAEDAARLDVWLTYVYMQFASDLADGLSDLAHVDPSWKIPQEAFDALVHLESALAANRVRQSLADLTPTHFQYRVLRDLLADYRKRAAAGGWPTVARSTAIRPGSAGAPVKSVAQRLAASGDYRGSVTSQGPMTYGPELQDAVKAFQRRHGLDENAVVGPAVVDAMNVPIQERIRQIELNLERWRWLPRDLGARHVLVNIPAYRLDVWEAGKVALSMRVVVGKKDTPTPIFSDDMTHIVFSPYWNVPQTIARDETLPSVMQDPAFLRRMNMEVVDGAGRVIDPGAIDAADPSKYRFRQRPGGHNSLGLVKFMFPNRFNVYLHDTPADSLFARATRSFSHGCVRLEQPQALAEYVLKDRPEWSSDRIAEAMHASDEQTVKLRKPLPVYMLYWTADVTPEGSVQFRPDIYGVDARQAAKRAERIDRQHRVAQAGVEKSIAQR
jgi:L,D-transpeptidase YcbB